jgi:L-fucose/D-arabinose isomerase
MKVGIVTFDFPPQYRRADVAGRPTANDSPLYRLLTQKGAEVVAPVARLAAQDPGAAGGIRDGRDLALCVDALRAARVDCAVIDVFHWARLPLVSAFVGQAEIPVAAFANTGDGWNGVPCAAAICGSVREHPRTRRAALVEAFLDTDTDGLFRWIAGASALSSMKRSKVMLWGGSYGAEMPYTRSDPAALEADFLAEVDTEQEEVLVERARRIIEGHHERIDRFFAWLASQGAAVRRDPKMVTPASLDYQAGLYLAARDRLDEMESDGGAPVAAASIKCHYEMSIACQGCTACLLPAFLPFGADAEGPRRIVPFACEGDLNGVVSVALLHALNPSIPPLFGDLVAFRPDHILVRNCGGSSVYWAARSIDPDSGLPGVTLGANLHGKSGAAVHYETPAGGPVTFARLFRQDGRFGMLVGEGTVAAASESSRYDDPWPHTRLVLACDPALLFRAAPGNHGSLTEGRLAREVEVACGYAGVPVYRCDDDSGLRALLRSRGAAGEQR